jgi:uncharacterized protein YccT (UPF0319 family)
MRSVFLFLIMLLPLNVNASVLMFPENILVVSVNGVEQSSGFFASETKLDLAAGEHILVLKYQDLFDGDDDHTKVSSEPFVMLFTLDETLATNKRIIVKTPNLNELSQARVFAKNPKIKLLTENGDEIISINQSLIKFNAQGKFLQLANANKSLTDAAVKNQRKKLSRNTIKTACLDKIKPVENLSQLNQLKCLWQETDKTEQEAFIYFVLAERQSSLQTLKVDKEE